VGGGDPATIDRELGFAELLGLNSVQVPMAHSPPVADDVVFQRLLYPDGTPYSDDEVELIRASTVEA
jgi:hypothetical protein